MGKKSFLRRVLKWAALTAGPAIYAAGVSLFIDPNSLATGGVTGISIILNRIAHLETGTLILLFNIPILAVGIWKFGIKFIFSTIYCTMLVSVFTNLFGTFPAVTNDLFLSTVVGGSLLALGMGIVFRAGATTGGMDIIVKLIRLKLPYMKTGSLFLTMDAVIIALSAFVFRDFDRAMYSGLTVFITSIVLDVVLYGSDEAKFIYIISDHYETITKRMLGELNIGVTYVSGVGAYSGREKNVIMCVVRKQIAPKVEEIVKEEDHMAFMIITRATEIYGEGYKNLMSERL